MGATQQGSGSGRRGGGAAAKKTPGGLAVGPELALGVFARTPDAIVVMDETGRIVEFNPAAEAIFGRSRDEALGQDMARLLIPARRRRAYRATLERFATGGDERELRSLHRRATTTALRADGTEIAVESTVVPLMVGGHRLFCEHIRDMSDLAEAASAEREARRRAAENGERLARFVTALPAAVLVEDEQRRVVLTNELFCEVFQIPATPAQLIGASSVPVIEESKQMAADPDGFLLRATQIVTARELVTDEEVPLADGRIYDRDYVPVRVGGEWRGQLWMYWDVTERRAFERQRERLLAAELKARKATEVARRRLDEQNQRLRELDELRADFMATLSHELRTPLTSIVSFTELLRDAEDSMSPQAAEFLGIIERNSERLLALISDLLLLGHVEGGSLPLDLAPASAAELADEAVAARSAPASRRGVTIEIAAEEGPPVRVDRHRMLQVLDNLLSNAIKFTEPGGTIRVTTHFDGDEWQIDVEDTGMGIPVEEQEEIFQRFFRASNARIEAVPGTGLGLSVVKAIVELHGGRLKMRSTPGKGTTFSVHLRAGS